MITKLTTNKKSQIILFCLILSLFIHLSLLFLHFSTPKSDFKFKPAPPAQKVKPITMMKQPPPSKLKRYRAGTGFDRPQTDKPLTPEPAQPDASPSQPAPPPAQPQPPMPEKPKVEPQQQEPPKQMKPQEKERSQLSRKPKPEQSKPQPPKPKTDLQTLKDYAPQARILKKFVEQQEQALVSQKNQQMLDFLAPQPMYEYMRQKAINSAAYSNDQYGDPRFFHYNQKVSKALRQSININKNHYSQQQILAILGEAKRPTRLRISLDKDGKVTSIRLLVSSESERFDAMTYQFIRDASFPPIPASFNMHTTYHNMEIIPHGTGYGVDTISPYLEGE